MKCDVDEFSVSFSLCVTNISYSKLRMSDLPKISNTSNPLKKILITSSLVNYWKKQKITKI